MDANVGEMSGRPVLPFPCYMFKRKRMVYSAAMKKSQVPLRQRRPTRDDGNESTGTTEFRPRSEPGPSMLDTVCYSKQRGSQWFDGATTDCANEARKLLKEVVGVRLIQSFNQC